MQIFNRFSIPEMKRIYRGFKTDCPTGFITEEAFHSIFARFFPNGGAKNGFKMISFSLKIISLQCKNDVFSYSAHFLWKDLQGKTRSSLRTINPKQSRKERKDAQNSQGREIFQIQTSPIKNLTKIFNNCYLRHSYLTYRNQRTQILNILCDRLR